MRRLANLELHVTHGCNLACESCSHYSNHGHKGQLSLEQAEQWMRPWGARLKPDIFSLLGGEPTIHPDLPKFIALARACWPDSHLRIVTNGFFLHRHPTLPQAMQDDGNTSLYLSIHHEDRAYLEKLGPNLQLFAQWRRDYRIDLGMYRSIANWTRHYKGFGATMEPFDDREPRASWERCQAKTCPQLFEGRIWKCAPLAYLRMQDEKFKLPASWKPYLGYEPLAPGCTDAELGAFFDREEESHCNMCPAQPQAFAMPLPLKAITSPTKR